MSWDIESVKLCKSAPTTIEGDRRQAARALALKLFALQLGNSIGGPLDAKPDATKVAKAMQAHWRGKMDSDSLFDCVEAVQSKAVTRAKERGEQERFESNAAHRERERNARIAWAEEEAIREARKQNAEGIRTLAERLGVQTRRAYQIADEGTTDREQAKVAAKVLGGKPSEYFKRPNRRGPKPDLRTIRAAFMRGYRNGFSWQSFLESQGEELPDTTLTLFFENGYRRNDSDVPDHFEDFYSLSKFARKQGFTNGDWLQKVWAAYMLWRCGALYAALLEDLEGDAYDFD